VKINLQSRPLLNTGQYTSKLGDYRLYYNPEGYGGVTVVDQQTSRILDLCDGNHTVRQLTQIDGRDPSVVAEEISTLANQEVVFISQQLTNEIHERQKKKGSMSCWMHLTNRCNLACSYCYIHKSPGDMTTTTGKLIIDKMIESCVAHGIGSMNIKFAGGEPLLRFELLKELVDYSKQGSNGKIEVTYTVLTNAALVTEEIADYLISHNIGIGVSLDGIGVENDKSRHDRRGVGSFDRVIAGIETLVRSGKRPSIMTTVSSDNYLGLLDLTKFLIGGGYRFRFSLQRDCESGWPDLLNHEDELLHTLHGCYDYMEANLPKDNFAKVHTFGDVKFQRPARRSCGAGNSFFAVGHDGQIGVCGLGLAKPFASINDQVDILDLVRQSNPKLADTLASDSPRCNNCIWRKSCASGCPLQTLATYGRYDRPTPYCRVYREILPRVIRIRGMQMVHAIAQATQTL